MLVVHCKKAKYDVYIGRGRCPKTGKPSPWGNPFVLGVDGDREEVLIKYENWLRNNQVLLRRLHELDGQTLGCWCKPKFSCHGDILIKIRKEQIRTTQIM